MIDGLNNRQINQQKKVYLILKVNIKLITWNILMLKNIFQFRCKCKSPDHFFVKSQKLLKSCVVYMSESNVLMKKHIEFIKQER